MPVKFPQAFQTLNAMFVQENLTTCKDILSLCSERRRSIEKFPISLLIASTSHLFPRKLVFLVFATTPKRCELAILESMRYCYDAIVLQNNLA